MSEFTQTAQADLGDIFAGMHPPVESPYVTILTSPTAYKRGMAMGKVTASGKYAPYNTSLSDGTQTFAGILVDDLDASGGDGVGTIYVQGEFLYGKIVAASPTVVPAGIYLSGGIVIKEAE
ncbi:head decoration protein [bacterium]|nr:head decoration protein [bacterium]